MPRTRTQRRPHAGRDLSGVLALVGAAACAAAPAAPDLAIALPWAEFAPVEFGGQGRTEVDAATATAVLHAGSPLTGLRWVGAPLPTVDYELTVTATRVQGSDFFCGLTFPVRDDHCTLVLGGWGGALVGLSCLDGADAAENDSTTHWSFVNGTPYRICVRVRADRITVAIDDKVVIDAAIAGRAVTLRADVGTTRPLAVCSYATTARLGALRLRRI